MEVIVSIVFIGCIYNLEVFYFSNICLQVAKEIDGLTKEGKPLCVREVIPEIMKIISIR